MSEPTKAELADIRATVERRSRHVVTRTEMLALLDAIDTLKAAVEARDTRIAELQSRAPNARRMRDRISEVERTGKAGNPFGGIACVVVPAPPAPSEAT